MKCSHCNADLHSNEEVAAALAYCPYCGEDLRTEENLPTIAEEDFRQPVVIVIRATDGVMEDTYDQVRKCYQRGGSIRAVELRGCDLIPSNEPDLIDLVELEARELLAQFGYDDIRIPVIRRV